MLPPGSIAAVLQLIAVGITLLNLLRRFNTRVKLEDDNVPSQKDIDAEQLAKTLDGTPINPEQYEDGIRIRRTLLVAISALAISLDIGQVAYTAAYQASTSLHSTWPTLCDALIWTLVLYLAFGAMIGDHLWFSILTSSSLLTIIFFSDLALLIIPQAIHISTASLSLHFGIAFLALLIAITTSSGPRHTITSSQGTFDLAPVGKKGNTVVASLWFTPSFPLIKTARRKGQLDETDTPLLGSDMSANVLHMQFNSVYQRARKAGTPTWIPTETLRGCWPLLRAIVLGNLSLFVNVVFWSAIAGLCFYAPAFVTFRIISFLEEQEQAGHDISGKERLRQGLPYCVLLAASMFLPTMMMSQVVTLAIQWLRNRIRIQLNTAIFAKALRRKDASGKKSSSDDSDDKEQGGASKTQTVNLASVDSERISMCIYLITFGMAPAEILLGGFFSIKLLGWGAVLGLSASLLLQPLIFFLGKLEASYNSAQQITRDRKTSLLNEVLQAIRMIKFNAWEAQTSARVKVVRQEELKSQRILFVLQAAQTFISIISPILVILVSYGWYTLVEKKPLTPAVAFTAMTVLQEMRFALTNIPDSIAQVIQALVSVQRIHEFLESDEVEVPQLGQKKGVEMKDATIKWPQMGAATKDDNEASFSLQSISVEFASDALNLVVGKIGSGKTLLLRALLGEADVVQGSVLCPRSLPSSIGEACPTSEQGWLREDQCCYVPQTAFLINASVKDNILFGLPLVESRYQSTLDACGLLPDLKLLEDGDETEIGENGIGLSGGQKIRVTLARAAYGRGATLLLDDCLSAVDAHTADHIYKNLIQGPLFAGRTVILVTHQVQLVAQSADKIIMLEDGKVRFQGGPSTFLNSDLYHGLIEEQDEITPSKEKDVELASEDVTPATTAPPSPLLSSTTLPKDPLPKEDIKATPRKLIVKEERAKGAVLLSIYARYITAAGGLPYALLLIVNFALANAFSIVTSRWLQYWSSDVLNGHQSHSNLWWISIWAALWALDVTIEVLKMLLLFYGSLRASEKLFMAMLDSVLLAPLRFHDTVSRGRLLNRFSYDFAETDSELAMTFERVGDQIIVTLASIFVVTSGSGFIFIVAIAVLSPIYFLVGRLYMIAVRDMKRLGSTTRSPIISTFSDVVSGVSVIRAFGGSDHFFATLAQRIEFNVTFYFWSNQLRWWYEQIFTALSFTLILLAAIVILLDPSIGAARAGFVFTFLNAVHHHLLFLLQAYSNMEQKLVSVERIVEYTLLEPEVEKKNASVPAAWPTFGAVHIRDLRIRYATELPDVIKGITVSIPGGAKVGVVGPTGCGKSTLASSFFRFVETSAGSISIDGIDIASVPLKDLRSRLQIVPQDPIILSGPLRSSVDVQHEFSDEQVRQALRDVQLLKETTSGSDTPSQKSMHDLQHSITEGGGNLSNGEKQLLCLARAILRRSKLIIFDEATSSVDFDTDQAISSTIQNAFKDSTIITIAHRLRTIIDYDLVMVMDDGKVVEFDSPVTLLQDSSTRFYKLCKASGKRELAHLKSMAGL